MTAYVEVLRNVYERRNKGFAGTKKKLTFSKIVDPRINGRGNPLLVRRRVMTMQDVDKKMSELK